MVEIIMEVGSIHDGSVGNAKKAIEFAARIGVDTIKFQIQLFFYCLKWEGIQ